MKIAVIGADGQLGSDISSITQKEFETVSLTINDIDISDFDSCQIIKAHKPDVIINTAAFHNVPECETNPVKSFEVNALGPFNLAKICKEIKATLVHISTDYVFDGKKSSPYLETDCPRPLNMYGITKLSGEQIIQYSYNKHFVIRTSGLYGEHKCLAKGRNFPELMVNLQKQGKDLKVVDDEFLTPTFTYDLALQIRDLIKTDKYGLYHITNSGSCSWYEFACKIFEILNIKAEIAPVPASTFPSTVQRPAYSVLENQNLKGINLDNMRIWQDALADYLSRVTL